MGARKCLIGSAIIKSKLKDMLDKEMTFLRKSSSFSLCLRKFIWDKIATCPGKYLEFYYESQSLAT